EKPAPKPIETGGLVLEQEEPLAVQALPEDIAGKSPPEIALVALKAALIDDETFKAALWHVIQSPTLAIPEVVSFLDIAALIYDASNGLIVRLRLPRFYTAKHLGKGKVQFKEKERYRTAPTTGLGLDEFELVQQHNLKYNGPLSKAAKDHIKTQKQEKQRLESELAAAQELLQRQLNAQHQIQPPPAPKPVNVPTTAMSPPPLPVSTPGGSMKITLKRKQSSTAEPRASSPKRPHLVQPPTNGTAATPKVEKSPSLNLGKIHAQTPSRTVSGASAPGSAAPSRKPTASDRPSKSKVVRLKITKQKRLQRILSQAPQPGYRPQKQKPAIPAKINTSTSARPSPAPSAAGGSQARGGSNGDFFASPEVTSALSTGASVGAFRSWNGISAVKQETDSAPLSAISPMTTNHPGTSNGTATATTTGTMSPRPSEGGEEKKPKFKLKFGKKPTA
ncbi:hypothetical protein KCV02_g13369, partial [Aureobasidium melanogenum]